MTTSLSAPYPNPASGYIHLTLTLDRPATTTLEVFDVLGRMVRALLQQRLLSSGEHPFIWYALDYAVGTYFVRVQAE